MNNNNNTGPCPVCNGTTRVDAGDVKYSRSLYGYNIDDNTVPCKNCGGQYMFGKPSGVVPLRKDGSPCTHEYSGRSGGRCYTIYTCNHCSSSYSIDSGD
jgi:hypothetical protein